MRKPEERRAPGRPWRRWADNIKIDLRETGWDGMDWIDVAQDSVRWRVLMNTIMNLLVPYNARKFSRDRTAGRFPRRAQLLKVKIFLAFPSPYL
jgi:hypothetical protein